MSRNALDKYSAKEWFKARTRKLLVPGTIGLFVFHWMVGYFNTVVASRQVVFDGVPAVAKYIIMAVSGTGPLWFIQVLWLLCIVLLIVRALDKKDKFWNWCGKAWIPLMVSAVIAGCFLIGTTFGQDNTSPEYLGSPLNSIYGWLMCLAMMGLFQARWDCTNAFSGYMTRSSYGIYIIHYLPVAAFATHSTMLSRPNFPFTYRILFWIFQPMPCLQ